MVHVFNRLKFNKFRRTESFVEEIGENIQQNTKV